MSNTKTALPMKGIYTPQFLIWCRGFWHGRILHTGGLNPETNVIASGYVTGQTRRFRNACIARREEAETKLARAWCDADQLLIDYAAVTSALADAGDPQNTPCESNDQVRSCERAASRRASREADRQSILKNLAKIANEIRAEYNAAHDQMEATAELLASVFACYGHGLLMKPVCSHNLPAVSYEDCAKQIIGNHEDTWNAIVTILKETRE